jgi:queuine tRNA-ribosyltransferase subunit QTRTD1
MINHEIGLKYFQISFPFDISENGKCIMSNWDLNNIYQMHHFPSLGFSDLEKHQFQSKDLKYLDLNESIYEKDTEVIKQNCGCFTCTNNYSRAYIHHLLKCKELNAGVLLSL